MVPCHNFASPLAQVNATVGDLDGNASLVASWTARAAEKGAHLVVFPEMVLTGYPVEDLALRESFAAASRAGAVDAGGPAGRSGPRLGRGGRELPGPGRGRAARRGGGPVRGARGGDAVQAPPAELRGVRRAAVLQGGRHARHRAAARRRGRPGDLRGHLAGGRPDRRARRRRASTWWCRRTRRRTSGTRTTCGCRSWHGGPQRRTRRWCTSTWSAARTTSCSTATRWWCPSSGELLTRLPQFVEHLTVMDLDLPG